MPETTARNKCEECRYYDYICFKVTSYRPESAPIVPMSGSDVRHDLSCLIEDLSESADIRAEEIGGVTKERIRQIEARARNKLRAAAKDERIEFIEAFDE